MFAGGPGQSAEAIVPFAAQLSGVRKNRDIVLIDPRGAGRSAPLNCAALSLRDPFDALLEDAMSDAVAKRCLTELRDAGSADIAQYTTLSFVNDLEQIRATLGYDRINLWGGSYGGFLTAMGLARNSDIFASGVDFHGVHDWSEFLPHWENRPEAPDKKEAEKLAFESSPNASISSWKSPVLLIQGDDDRNVPFEQTVDLVQRLRENHVRFEQIVLPDEIHGFLMWKSWIRVYKATADFFDRTLKVQPASH